MKFKMASTTILNLLLIMIT